MFSEDLTMAVNAGKTKLSFLSSNPIGYFLASCLAGIYVGFGILLIFSIGGMLNGSPSTKIIMGISFGIALSLVIAAGSELFTGNNFIMAVGILAKEVSIAGSVKLWIVCFVGNWIGSIVLALLFYFAGLAGESTGEFITATAATKMSLSPIQLLIRGMLCNTLVCLAVWCSFRLKSDAGKLIMVFWCLFAFITSGFEHSIANMTLLTLSLLCSNDAGVTLTGYFYNIGWVTAGNMLGAIIILAIPYYLMGRRTKSNKQNDRKIVNKER